VFDPLCSLIALPFGRLWQNRIRLACTGQVKPSLKTKPADKNGSQRVFLDFVIIRQNDVVV